MLGAGLGVVAVVFGPPFLSDESNTLITLLF